jgi:hypothetical protein
MERSFGAKRGNMSKPKAGNVSLIASEMAADPVEMEDSKVLETVTSAPD